MAGDIPLQFPGAMLPSQPSSLPPAMQQMSSQFQGHLSQMQSQMSQMQHALDMLVMHGSGDEEDDEEEEEEEEEESSESPPNPYVRERPPRDPVAKKPGQCFFNTHLHNQCA